MNVNTIFHPLFLLLKILRTFFFILSFYFIKHELSINLSCLTYVLYTHNFVCYTWYKNVGMYVSTSFLRLKAFKIKYPHITHIHTHQPKQKKNLRKFCYFIHVFIRTWSGIFVFFPLFGYLLRSINSAFML